MLSRGQGFDPIYRFNHTKFVCLSQVRTWISNVICRGFCVLSEFSFVDIGGIDDHHSLKFLFIFTIKSGGNKFVTCNQQYHKN